MVSMKLDIDNGRYWTHIDADQYRHRPEAVATTRDASMTKQSIEAALELNEIQQTVRDRYAGAAIAASTAALQDVASRALPIASCCGPAAAGPEVGIDGSLAAVHAESCCGDGCCTGASATNGLVLYDAATREGLPDAAVLASLGCGNPIAVAELREGETVLDLGSGGGIDVLLSARRVGPTGHAIGVDMTDEMLALARRNATEAGATNVEFRMGTIEALPIADASVDVVISNCVINLASDKGAVFTEIARVLKPGGRIGVSDIVADDTLTAEQRAERGSYVGCIAGALSFREFRQGLRAAGLTDIELVPTHQVGDGLHSAIVRATKAM
jgi:arsenite methyltransferase